MNSIYFITITAIIISNSLWAQPNPCRCLTRNTGWLAFEKWAVFGSAPKLIISDGHGWSPEPQQHQNITQLPSNLNQFHVSLLFLCVLHLLGALMTVQGCTAIWNESWLSSRVQRTRSVSVARTMEGNSRDVIHRVFRGIAGRLINLMKSHFVQWTRVDWTLEGGGTDHGGSYNWLLN